MISARNSRRAVPERSWGQRARPPGPRGPRATGAALPACHPRRPSRRPV